MQQREKSQGDQNVVKYRQDSGSPVNPLESEGNIYQHACQSIEGNENGLTAEFGAHLGADNLNISNCEAAESVTALQNRKHCGRDAVHGGQIVETRDHAILGAIAVGQNFLSQLLVSVASIDRQIQWIVSGEQIRQGRRRS